MSKLWRSFFRLYVILITKCHNEQIRDYSLVYTYFILDPQRNITVDDPFHKILINLRPKKRRFDQKGTLTTFLPNNGKMVGLSSSY